MSDHTSETVTTTVQPLPGGGMVETIEREAEFPTSKPLVIEPAPEPVDLAPVQAALAALTEQVTALVARVDNLSAAPPSAAPSEPPAESALSEDEEDILELEDAKELPEPTAKETTIKPSDDVTKEKPSKRKHAGFFL